jgi:hypothetical protein
MMAVCVMCSRSLIREHLIDGDFCPDCWEWSEEE